MISIIVAVARDGVIGAGGSMPWHLPEDLAYFKRVTTGHTVIMGRRTFESLGRPLPNRTNVVITRNPEFAAERGLAAAGGSGKGGGAAGVEVAHSLAEAIEKYPDSFIIGGAEIYRQALPLADRLYLTRIDADYDGDTHFPAYDENDWMLVSSERHERGADFPHPFEFRVYSRNK